MRCISLVALALAVQTVASGAPVPAAATEAAYDVAWSVEPDEVPERLLAATPAPTSAPAGNTTSADSTTTVGIAGAASTQHGILTGTSAICAAAALLTMK
eukprot:TRINITY_DN1052_c0_g2_i1.p1 TRINITY_DN1052_c0_g2~~TRINITY_DN1052_c0_g2_i1.p1  ORF type:complete len:100 (+),score=22.56 TRINITY_DN1052_c0_g2_i1:106-405(+)